MPERFKAEMDITSKIFNGNIYYTWINKITKLFTAYNPPKMCVCLLKTELKHSENSGSERRDGHIK